MSITLVQTVTMQNKDMSVSFDPLTHSNFVAFRKFFLDAVIQDMTVQTLLHDIETNHTIHWGFMPSQRAEPTNLDEMGQVPHYKRAIACGANSVNVTDSFMPPGMEYNLNKVAQYQGHPIFRAYNSNVIRPSAPASNATADPPADLAVFIVTISIKGDGSAFDS
jgi:hypothetical protein